MESSLHRRLKEIQGLESGGRCEVAVGGFRIDAVDGDGVLVEIQSGALGPLRPKLRALLPEHPMRVVKPIVVRRIVVRRDRIDGPDLSRRTSPKRGRLDEVFNELVGLAPLLAESNLTLEVLGVEVEEVRITRRRRPGFAVCDRRLLAVVDSVTIDQPTDLWSLIPRDFSRTAAFTTADLAKHLGRPLDFAQRVAYCLCQSGAIRIVGKQRNARVYQEVGASILSGR